MGSDLSAKDCLPSKPFFFMLDAAFHNISSVYSDRSIRKALDEHRLTADDVDLIREFVLEISASQGLSTSRTNKITGILVNWRQSLLVPYRDASVSAMYQGIENQSA